MLAHTSQMLAGFTWINFPETLIRKILQVHICQCMEERAGTGVETSLVIVNTTTAEPEEIQETRMGDEDGREVQGEHSGQQDGNQVDNNSGEAHL